MQSGLGRREDEVQQVIRALLLVVTELAKLAPPAPAAQPAAAAAAEANGAGQGAAAAAAPPVAKERRGWVLMVWHGCVMHSARLEWRASCHPAAERYDITAAALLVPA